MNHKPSVTKGSWSEFVFSAKWRDAMDFAKQKHEGQMRDEGVPYFTHVKGVVEILIKECNVVEEDVLTVAALHDVLEDTDCTYEEMKERFGKDIADAVVILTHDKKNGQSFEEYSKNIFTNKDFPYVGKIKIADRLHNLRTLENTKKPEKIKRKVDETEKCILIYENESNAKLMKKLKEEIRIIKENQSHLFEHGRKQGGDER